jgi:hypothetical protein
MANVAMEHEGIAAEGWMVIIVVVMKSGDVEASLLPCPHYHGP